MVGQLSSRGLKAWSGEVQHYLPCPGMIGKTPVCFLLLVARDKRTMHMYGVLRTLTLSAARPTLLCRLSSTMRQSALKRDLGLLNFTHDTILSPCQWYSLGKLIGGPLSNFLTCPLRMFQILIGRENFIDVNWARESTWAGHRRSASFLRVGELVLAGPCRRGRHMGMRGLHGNS
ncbi:uncharacterized protein EI97DRAFT_85422 [Westerdykella ornata]|uniref:Uncharacterized protein n=1 Tax=Westerdykella ornata TaxID=318751 RepID=A0A6A6JGC3_WESOR|nr:uncharacterized protein EI97DRAFT_85422 [Westerdykella ornata]KAF2275028.1 hypothetical protein EI97DRAFT_85422 [Westerdykella ornata]